MLGEQSLAVYGVTACAPAENFDNLEPEKASSKHLDQLQSWALPSTEAEDARRAFVSRCVSARGGKYSEAQKDYSIQTSLRNGADADQLKGCFAESLQYIYGTVEDGLKVAVLAPQLLQSLGENVREEPVYKEVENAWGTCMKDHLDTYFETVYQRIKRFADDFEKIQQRSQENVLKDRENPQKSSPVEQAQPTDATSTS